MKKIGLCLSEQDLRINPFCCNSDGIRDMEEMKMMFLEGGYTYFDTTGISALSGMAKHFSEGIVRKYSRMFYTVADEISLSMVHQEDELDAFFYSQLSSLGLEYFDYYWMQNLSIETWYQIERIHAAEFLREKKKEGKIRHIGLSVQKDSQRVEEILIQHPEIEYIELQVKDSDWKNEAEAVGKMCEKARSSHRPIILSQSGTDRKADAAHRAMEFAAKHDNIMMVLPDAHSAGQMAEYILYFQQIQEYQDQKRITDSSDRNIYERSLCQNL